MIINIQFVPIQITYLSPRFLTQKLFKCIPIRINRFDVIRIDAKVKIIIESIFFESVTMTFF